jgi:hypothetical protein
MILKRVEKDNLIKALYDSSNILASTYDNSTNELCLIFKGGRKYKYSNVSKSDYMRFEIAESQGDIFNTHIKKYSFERLEDVDPTKIITEAETLKASEQEILLEGKKAEVIDKMKKILPLEKDEHFDEMLKELQVKLNDYLVLLSKK